MRATYPTHLTFFELNFLTISGDRDKLHAPSSSSSSSLFATAWVYEIIYIIKNQLAAVLKLRCVLSTTHRCPRVSRDAVPVGYASLQTARHGNIIYLFLHAVPISQRHRFRSQPAKYFGVGSPTWIIHPHPHLFSQHNLGPQRMRPDDILSRLAASARRMRRSRDVHNILKS
jgi:hypothetical protein